MVFNTCQHIVSHFFHFVKGVLHLIRKVNCAIALVPDALDTSGMKKPRKPTKTTSTGKRKVNRHKHPHVGLNLEESLIRLVDSDRKDSERSRAAQIRLIIKEYYRSRGVLPPIQPMPSAERSTRHRQHASAS